MKQSLIGFALIVAAAALQGLTGLSLLWSVILVFALIILLSAIRGYARAHVAASTGMEPSTEKEPH